MVKLKRLRAKVEKHSQYNVPRRIYDIESQPSKEDPQRIAESVLKNVAPDLKIKPDLSQLKFDKVKETLLGSHVLYQQQHRGKPISGAWVRVDIDKEGRVYNIQNDLVPETIIGKSKKKEEKSKEKAAAPAKELSSDEAKSRALEATAVAPDSANEVLDNELVYYPHNGIPKLAWKIIVKTTKPMAEWRIYLDALNGSVLDKINQLKYNEGQGKVFDPNPVVTLNNTQLEDNSRIPTAAYSEVILRDLKDTGMLDGPFVSTRKTPNRVKRTGLQFLFEREDRAFKEVMVYFHIDRMQRHIQELGFNNVLNHPIEVDIDGITDDNSFYSPATKSLTFGTGGVDDAEDAEIILHEYGHAIQDDQVPGWGQHEEGAAMGEGFGDYNAASFFAETKPLQMRLTLGNWDATSYSGSEPPYLRRLDSNKKYPKDLTHEPHDDGEIWSACLWEIRAALGRKITDTLVIAHHFLLSRTATFENAANALITADKNLNEGRNEDVIRDVFVRRGIFPNQNRKNKRAGLPFDQLG
jgi:Fungalysin metallopeptidase (M36)/Fungalysin/Thermolysin Propeptide Motif